ncbi:MAG: pyridoxamine 5'-phosphate oxidase family protein [Crenarchaeota archaeon]|nr:MAG: pyridoxamine 5'-phosphate oxidase family protein [Thermoproteota archaeon]RDJ33808.1 MAG: pyridoxamine 5'-phosphate oxidase family protein [Thermoproteota archaeon]RDJ37083.1 MAG: pyridoxamine 5'-phosphate oxidase family protein [Thermoproteota archaeon]RDJ37382.1 MAG: pyridoxamine 5'-phosphate oxidase family protein [Thermoproteota archaeon]
MITKEIQSFLKEQKLGYVATVSSDNMPNLSPKGTIVALDEKHLIFAEIRSPKTIANLKINPKLEINVVDPLIRKGYRFKGDAKIITYGDEFEKITSEYKKSGIKSKINAIVKIKVSDVEEVTSPLYDLGFSEEEIKQKWKKIFLDR